MFLLGGRSETLRGLGGPGRDGTTYALIGALGGVAYIAAVAWQRLRS